MKIFAFASLLASVCLLICAILAKAQTDEESCIFLTSYFTAESASIYNEKGEEKITKDPRAIDAQAAFVYSLLPYGKYSDLYTTLHEPSEVCMLGPAENAEIMPSEVITSIFPNCPATLIDRILDSNPTCAHRGSGYYFSSYGSPRTIVTPSMGTGLGHQDYTPPTETDVIIQATNLCEHDTLWVCGDTGKYVISSVFEYDKSNNRTYSDIDTSKPRKWIVVKLNERYYKHTTLTGPLEDHHISLVKASCYSERGELLEPNETNSKLQSVLKYAIQPGEKMAVDHGLPGINVAGLRFVGWVSYKCEMPLDECWSHSPATSVDRSAPDRLSAKDAESLAKKIAKFYSKCPKEEINHIITLNPSAAYRHQVQYQMIGKAQGIDEPFPSYIRQDGHEMYDFRVTYDIMSIIAQDKVIFFVAELMTWFTRRQGGAIEVMFKGLRDSESAYYIIEGNRINSSG